MNTDPTPFNVLAEHSTYLVKPRVLAKFSPCFVDTKFSEFSEQTLKKSDCSNYYLVVTGQMHGAAINLQRNRSGESRGEFWTWENSDCTKEFLDSKFIEQNIDFGRRIYSGYGLASLLLSAEQEKNKSDSEYRADWIDCYGTIMDTYLYNFRMKLELTSKPRFQLKSISTNFRHLTAYQMTDQNAEAFGLYMKLKENPDPKAFPEIYEGIEHMKKRIISLQHNFMKDDYVKIIKFEELGYGIKPKKEMKWTIFPALADHQCSVFDQVHSVNKIRNQKTNNENKVSNHDNPLFLINLGTSCQLSQIVDQETWNQLKSQHQIVLDLLQYRKC